MLQNILTTKLFRRPTVQLGLFGAASLLTWASWQEPSLHDYPQPISVAAVRLAGPGTALAAMHDQVVRLPGITACTVNADARSLAFTYHPDEVTPAQVCQQLPAAWHAQLYQAPMQLVAGPQCPVPQGYLVALDRLRFALNLRRLFVNV